MEESRRSAGARAAACNPDSQKSESTVFVKNHGRYVGDATQYRLLPDAMCRFRGVSHED